MTNDITAGVLRVHLSERYGVAVTRIRALDRGVFEVAREDGSRWVARAYPDRPPAAVQGDAHVLHLLGRGGFPAERCADVEPVSVCAGTAVLVTEYVPAAAPLRPGRTAALLGVLLGRLHAAHVHGLPPGGAWHHLAAGTPADEVAAATAALDVDGALLDEVLDTDDCADLPHAFVHPDFVAANAIPTPDERLVIVDWTGAGRGPRLWSLGFALFAAGSHSLKMIEPLLSRYLRSVTLEAEELARLQDAIRARPVMLQAWAYAVGRRTRSAAESAIAQINRRAAEIARASLACAR